MKLKSLLQSRSALTLAFLFAVTLASRAEIYLTYGGTKLGLFTDAGVLIRDVATDLSNPQGVAVDAAGKVFVSDWGNKRIRAYDRTGKFTGDVMSPSYQGGSTPYGLSLDSSGNLYASVVWGSDPNGNALVKWDTKGTDKIIASGVYAPTYEGLCYDAPNNRLLTTLHADVIQQFIYAAVGSAVWKTAADLSGVTAAANLGGWLIDVKFFNHQFYVTDNTGGALKWFDENWKLLGRASVSAPAYIAYTTNASAAVQRVTGLRLEAKDQGVILKHGDGPDNCDTRGMREPSIVQADGKFYLFYDGCAAPGWLACLATSDDLKTWKKHGRALSLGPKGSDDSATASSPWVIKEGEDWHMFYLGCQAASPAPDYIPIGPYFTMKATAKSLLGPWTQQRDIVPFRPIKVLGINASPGHIVKHGDEWLMFFSGAGALGIARTKNLEGPWTPDPGPVFNEHMHLENASIYYEEANGTWWLFVNHIDAAHGYTAAVWAFWSKDLEKWNSKDRTVVLDGQNCTWSKKCVGMASVTKVGNRLAIFYDAAGDDSISHMNRDIGLTWLDLPLRVQSNAPPSSAHSPTDKN
ncbi:MAG: hypothetical protein NTZ16_07310 [Verrucomicrobia bacterium]|nr:hypothetical protein [Verrucomicrobiota bacterium]